MKVSMMVHGNFPSSVFTLSIVVNWLDLTDLTNKWEEMGMQRLTIKPPNHVGKLNSYLATMGI